LAAHFAASAGNYAALRQRSIEMLATGYSNVNSWH
jgi:hypothetical protein